MEARVRLQVSFWIFCHLSPTLTRSLTKPGVHQLPTLVINEQQGYTFLHFPRAEVINEYHSYIWILYGSWLPFYIIASCLGIRHFTEWVISLSLDPVFFSPCFYTCEVKQSSGAGDNHSCLDYRNLGHHVLILVDLYEWPHPFSFNKQSLLESLRPPSPPLPDPSSRGTSGYFLLMRMEMLSSLIQYGRDVSVTVIPIRNWKKLQALTCNPLGYEWAVPTCNLSLWLLYFSVILTSNVIKRLRWQCN